MKSKINFLMLLTLALVCSISAEAYDFECNGFYYNIKSLSNLTVSLTGDLSNPYSGDVIVPSEVVYAGKTFTVAEIENSAFLGCHLGNISVPPSVINAKIYADGLTETWNYITGSIDSITIEDSDIPFNKISGKANKSIYIGRDPDDSGSLNFYGTSIETLVFGEGVTKVIGSFSESHNLHSITMPNVRYIGLEAFSYCTKLKEIDGPNVEYIGSGTFVGCTSLETFSFPNLKEISNGYTYGAFGYCTALKNVVLPQGLMYLGNIAFHDCTNLESVTLPTSLMEMADSYECKIFANCPNLMNITVCNKTPLPIREDTFDQLTYVKATLYVPIGTKESYQTADVWNNFFKIVEDPSIKDDVVSVELIENFSNGSIHIQNSRQKYHIGDEITIVFEPVSENYNVSKVLINNVDMISQVVDNRLTFTLEGNTTIYAEFSWHYVPPVDYYLTIKQGEMGCVKMKVSGWEDYKFKIEPNQDYRIHSVTYNGEDITEYVIGNDGVLTIYADNCDAVLNIAFESTSEESITSINGRRVKVLGVNDSIKIIGYDEGESMALYNIKGQLMQSLTLHGPETVISVDSGQVYIVKFKDKIVKIAL